MRQGIRVAVVAAAVAMSAAACNTLNSESYTVFAGGAGDDARGAATVRVTVDGAAVTDGTETFSDGRFQREVDVSPGQTVVVDVTSKDFEPSCDIDQPGPSAEHIEITERESERDSSGTWHTSCIWKRPASE